MWDEADQDWEGTERAVTSYNGSVEGTYTSLPFGDGYSVSGSDIDPYHFAMLDRDSTSDTDHATFRQYGNTQGRWMSPDPYAGSYDPSNPQSMNRYSYVLNDPLAFDDPWGLEIVDCPPGTPDGTFCVDTWDDGGDGGGGGGGGGYLPTGIGDGPGQRGATRRAPKKAMAIPPGAPPKSCTDQLVDMLNYINSVRGGSDASGFKGLAQRFAQILNGSYANTGHIEQFQNRQAQLQKKIDKYRNSGCGEPPPAITAWANTPMASPWTPPNLQNFNVPSWVAPAAVITGGTACAVFVPGCLEVEGAVILAP